MYAAGGVVRRARLDRPLGRKLLDPGYADEALEGVLAAAAGRAQDAARALGYAAGWAQGCQAAAGRAAARDLSRTQQAETDRQALARDAERLLGALAEAIRGQQQADLPQWNEVADALADGALALAAAAIGRELSAIEAPMAEAVRVALRVLGDPQQVVVRLNPADAAQLSAADLPSDLRLQPDASVPAGTVLAQTPVQRLLFNLPAALAAAERVLRS